ncbi:flavoprotein [Jiangella alkaliphila]|uniref:Flavoprotein n=1 Tax=Jiangella alkaliphila TaxID=419479 RepID=A0A1H2L250_9ACTN|nr:flavoprotein [Jiangella alkaliphila]SDU74864.1 Flavoprotein [Jiangella alkaliphila]
MTGPVLGLIACAAGGIEDLRTELIEPMQRDGWTVAVTVTPTAATWLRASGEFDRIEDTTGQPVRDRGRLPSEASPHPQVDCYAVVPATANTVAKLALGIADNHALTGVSEAIGNRAPPIVVFPRINAAHAAHPAWHGYMNTLGSVGVRLVVGDDVWPLHAPRSMPGRQLPWSKIRNAIDEETRRVRDSW